MASQMFFLFFKKMCQQKPFFQQASLPQRRQKTDDRDLRQKRFRQDQRRVLSRRHDQLCLSFIIFGSPLLQISRQELLPLFAETVYIVDKQNASRRLSQHTASFSGAPRHSAKLCDIFPAFPIRLIAFQDLVRCISLNTFVFYGIMIKIICKITLSCSRFPPDQDRDAASRIFHCRFALCDAVV